MPVIYELDSDGSLGDEVKDGGCWGFLGRLDSWEEQESAVYQFFVEKSSQLAGARSNGCNTEFDTQAEPYLTWLMEQSPYRNVFASTGHQAVQQGFATVNLDVCNQSLILGLSHLRRSTMWTHRVWNALPEGVPGGLKYMISLVLDPHRGSYYERCFGASYGDSTSTVMKYFNSEAWHAWLQNHVAPPSESYMELGGYHTDFCQFYEQAFDCDGELPSLLDGLGSFGYEVVPCEGLFFKTDIAVLNIRPTEVLEFIRTKLEGTDYCINKYLGEKDADVL